ncbi:MAG TPA: energy-coupling factor transporter transmembrane component T [Candidatus Nanoarchaeia archaeon]|nr:energy-coupling factor transporter transmembrane component T [Candidatus Nanoarchaeia archaeon]
MIRQLTLGQYRFKDSIIHRLDPRLKLIFVVAYSILIFAADSTIKIMLFSVLALVLALSAGIEIMELILNLRAYYSFMIFIILMYVIFARNQFVQGLLVIWRFFMLAVISYVLTYSTSISMLVAALERLGRPLKIFGIKPRNIAVMISATIRFIPVMFINFERARDAIKSRLGDFKKLKTIKMLMLALIEKMLKSASNLSDAMQARLYNENAVNSVELKLGNVDYFAIFLMSALLVAVIY